MGVAHHHCYVLAAINSCERFHSETKPSANDAMQGGLQGKDVAMPPKALICGTGEREEEATLRR